VKVTCKEAGKYEVDMQIHKQSIQNCPFDFLVQPCRDPKTLSNQHFLIIEDIEFKNPNSIAINSKGQLVIADTLNQQIQILDRTFKLPHRFGSQGKENGQFKYPDFNNHCVQKFTSLSCFTALDHLRV